MLEPWFQKPKLFFYLLIFAQHFIKTFCVMQSDIKQFDNGHFSRGCNFWTNDVILILKTPTCPYSCLAKNNYLFISCLNVRFISCRLIKSVSFWSVLIWLSHLIGPDRDPHPSPGEARLTYTGEQSRRGPSWRSSPQHPPWENLAFRCPTIWLVLYQRECSRKNQNFTVDSLYIVWGYFIYSSNKNFV